MLTPEKLKIINQTTGWGLDENIDLSQPIEPAPQIDEENDPVLRAIKQRAESKKTFVDKAVDVAKSVGGAIISSEKNFGDSLSAAASQILPDSITGQEALDEAEKSKRENQQKILTKLQEAVAQGKDTTKLLETLRGTMGGKTTTMKDLLPNTDKTAMQVAGEGAGVALDVLSAGQYGASVKGATSGKLYTSAMQKSDAAIAAQKALFDWSNKEGATTVATEVGKKTLGGTLKTIGKETAKNVGVGAATGYAYDVSNNLQNGETGVDSLKPGMGTLIGAVSPGLVGIYQGTKAVTKSLAPRFINSLIKPRLTEFSYGKNPGRSVSELGIVGNNLEDFGKNVTQKRQDIGAMLEGSYQEATNQGVKIDISDITKTFDDEITKASKGGKSNQGVVTALQNAKDALLYEHAVQDGIITKVGTTPKNLNELTPLEVFDTKTLVGGQTRFTGNPSDDKIVNATLKKVYGQIKDKLNAATKGVSPEIPDLNEKYADLLSAEIAIKNREAILQRADIIPFFSKMGTTAGAAGLAGIGAAAFTGVGLIPVLVGAGAAAVEKALSTTAFKTRMAKWLGNVEPSVLAKFFAENPGIKDAIYRAIPKAGSIIGQE